MNILPGHLVRFSSGLCWQFCDLDRHMATFVLEGVFLSIPAGQFFEQIGWDRRRQQHYLAEMGQEHEH